MAIPDVLERARRRLRAMNRKCSTERQYLDWMRCCLGGERLLSRCCSGAAVRFRWLGQRGESSRTIRLDRLSAPLLRPPVGTQRRQRRPEWPSYIGVGLSVSGPGPQRRPGMAILHRSCGAPGIRSRARGPSSYPPQHFLYFLPLPQGQGELGFAFVARAFAGLEGIGACALAGRFAVLDWTGSPMNIRKSRAGRRRFRHSPIALK